MSAIPEPPEECVRDAVARALAEDVGTGDRTAALVPPDEHCTATVICRERAVICGRAWFNEAFRQLDPGVTVAWSVVDGEAVAAETVLCAVSGPARPMLTGERTALNFLQLLSGTATATAALVERVAGSGVIVLDTRKTIPGLRLAQKYAVRCGGGQNHRVGLYDAILIKENHITAAGGVAAALAAARDAAAGLLVVIEVETLEQAREALTAGADRLLLDNFDPPRMREAAALRDRLAPAIALEASGGIDAASLGDVVGTGIDYISVGALTKHVRAIDLSMRFAFR